MHTEVSINSGRVWWHMPVIPAIWEAEAGESLEPGRQRLQWAGIVPLHSSLATQRDCVSKKKKNHRSNHMTYSLEGPCARLHMHTHTHMWSIRWVFNLMQD